METNHSAPLSQNDPQVQTSIAQPYVFSEDNGKYIHFILFYKNIIHIS